MWGDRLVRSTVYVTAAVIVTALLVVGLSVHTVGCSRLWVCGGRVRCRPWMTSWRRFSRGNPRSCVVGGVAGWVVVDALV